MKSKIIELIVTTKEEEKLPKIDNVYRLFEVLKRYKHKEKKPVTIQELHQEINILKTEVKTLRIKNESIDSRLVKLEQDKDKRVEEVNEPLETIHPEYESTT